RAHRVRPLPRRRSQLSARSLGQRHAPLPHGRRSGRSAAAVGESLEYDAGRAGKDRGAKRAHPDKSIAGRANNRGGKTGICPTGRHGQRGGGRTNCGCDRCRRKSQSEPGRARGAVHHRQAVPRLAVKKVPSPKFPFSYSLSAKDVMMPGAVFSGKLYVTARLDKDGDPLTHSPEDLAGEYSKNPVDVGSKKVDFVLAPARPDAR